ncbi:MAG: metalloregulator ArsR/SmtB family transcription factor [Sandaracinaceae bacterium]
MSGFESPRVCSPVELKRAADLLAALAHPIRLQIVDGLLAGQTDVTAMVECLGHPQALISKHLKVLRDAGVVLAVRDGRHRYYRVSRPEVAQILRSLPFRTVAETAKEIAS